MGAQPLWPGSGRLADWSPAAEWRWAAQAVCLVRRSCRPLLETIDYPEVVESAAEVRMPVSVAVRFAHAAAQAVADDCLVDLLHIKGPAVDDGLLEAESVTDPETGESSRHVAARESTDADVLVRPDHLRIFLDGMQRHGWSLKVDFADGSAFEHAATLEHPFLKHADVHRRFPGITAAPEVAFDRLWADRHTATIAGVACGVPSLPGQRLILLLHAARGPVAGHPDIRRAWLEATMDQRLEVEKLAAELGAEVGLAAGTGRLDEFQSARDHDLWQLLSSGDYSLASLWWARVRAEPTLWAGARAGIRLVLPNPNRLALQLGRTPTRRDLAAALVSKLRLGAGQAKGVLVRHRGRRIS